MTAPTSALIFGCGYLGQRVARRWIANGVKVTAVTRRAERASELQSTGIEAIVGDIAQPTLLMSLPKVDVMLWAVGYDRSSGQSREDVWLTALQATFDALATSGMPSRVFHVSSTSVFGDASGGDVAEETSPQPNTDSGRACRAAERITLASCAAAGVSCCILRLAGIYGPHRLLRRVEELKARVPIAADPDAWLNLIHVDDAADVIVQLSARDTIPEVVNVVAGNPVTRREYYSTLARMVDAPEPLFEPLPQQPAGRRGQSGNRRIISTVLPQLGIETRFNNHRAGLEHAVRGES